MSPAAARRRPAPSAALSSARSRSVGHERHVAGEHEHLAGAAPAQRVDDPGERVPRLVGLDPDARPRRSARGSTVSCLATTTTSLDRPRAARRSGTATSGRPASSTVALSPPMRRPAPPASTTPSGAGSARPLAVVAERRVAVGDRGADVLHRAPGERRRPRACGAPRRRAACRSAASSRRPICSIAWLTSSFIICSWLDGQQRDAPRQRQRRVVELVRRAALAGQAPLDRACARRARRRSAAAAWSARARAGRSTSPSSASPRRAPAGSRCGSPRRRR